MRICICGPMGNDSFAENVAETARRLEWHTFTLGPARPELPVRQVTNFVELLSDQRRQLDGYRQRRMITLVKELRPDLLLTTDRRLHPKVVSAAHEVGAKVALWFPDAVHNMGRHDMFVSGYDRIYLKNPELVKWLTATQGLPVSLLPEAANSVTHRSDVEYGTRREVILAGNVHPTRAVLLDRLVSDGIPLVIYGAAIPPWLEFASLRTAHTGRYLVGKEKAVTFRSARAVLNNLHPAEFAGTNCRLYEAAASGAAVLTEDRPGLETQFVPGKEVLPFSDYNTLLATLHRLLDDSEYGRALADAAADRAHRDHTYELRLQTIASDLL